MNHCDCCYPECPVPFIEREFKAVTCTGGFVRGSVYRHGKKDSKGKYGVYVVPLPEREQRFGRKKNTIKGSYSKSYTVKTPDESEEYTRLNIVISGGSSLTDIAGTLCTGSGNGCYKPNGHEGSANYNYTETQNDHYWDQESGKYKVYQSFKLAMSLVYGGKGSKIPNPDYTPGGGEDEYLHGDDTSFIKSYSRITKSPVFNKDGTFKKFKEKKIENKWFTVHGDYSYDAPNGESSGKIYRNGPGFHSYRIAYADTEMEKGCWFSEKDEWLEPADKGILVNAAKDCLGKAKWVRDDSAKAERKIVYNDVPVLNDKGETVYWDHDNDPDTPKVVKTKKLKSHPGHVFLRSIRWRIVIPHSFDPPPPPAEQRWHGEWNMCELIETFTPKDHNPDDPNSPQEMTVKRESEWNGPGLLIDYDGFSDLEEDEKKARRDSWKTDWVEIDAPNEEGTIDIALGRFKCVHSIPWKK